MKLSCLATFSLLLVLPFSSIAQDAEKPAITQSEIRDKVFMLRGNGGNVAVINGDRSLLVIDNGLPDLAADLYEAIVKVGNKPIRFLINTHWHFDHAGGNDYFGHRTNFVAHENVRKRLAAGQTIKAFNRVIEPAEPHALPVVTYTESLTLFEADQRALIKHFPNGHTDGDSVVFIEPSKIVHMGDLYFAGMFPFIDLESGGSVQGTARNIEAVLASIDDDWAIIPGHGPLSSKTDLKATLEMLQQSIAWMRDRLSQGLSLEQINGQGLPANLKSWETGFIKEANWIAILHASLNDE